MLNYNAIGTFTNTFRQTTSTPLIGFVINEEIPNSVQTALNSFNATTQNLLPGQLVTVEIPQAGTPAAAKSLDFGLNPNAALHITAVIGASGEPGNVSGFVVSSSNDVAFNQGYPTNQNGQLARVALLGGGATLWVELNSTNATAASSKAVNTNTRLTLDTADGTLKFADKTDTAIPGIRVLSGVMECEKYIYENGQYQLKSCFGIKVQLI